jgi:membrane-associated phospholipid phosphatase
VMMATVLLKQHYLPDILGGILVALVSIAAVKYLKLI